MRDRFALWRACAAMALFLSLASSHLLVASRALASQEYEYDLVLQGGKIVDGSGSPWFYGDVGVSGDQIVSVTHAGHLAEARAREKVDATGLVVAPGFIDILSHSRDNFLTGDGRVISKITQGITTEIMGEGWTNAPSNERTVAAAGTADPASRAFANSFEGPRGFNNWLEAMYRHGASPNIGSFLGATTVRMYVKGMSPEPPDESEIEMMRTVVRNAMEDGAFGIATSLIYPPGVFATTEELIEMAREMEPLGGIYITHMRSEADQVLAAMDEAIRIGREGGVPVEIYHLKAAGRRNWAKSELMIDKINRARGDGLDIAANMYPYVAGGTGLTACFPPWAAAGGNLMRNLTDPEARKRIKDEILRGATDWEDLCSLAGPQGVLVLGLNRPENRAFIGKRLSEIADATGKHWIDAAMDLVVSEQHRVGTIYFLMSEENVKLKMRQPWMKFGTDAGGADPENPRGLVHPRSYGTYTRILGKYVRDEQVISLEEAVRKMSSAVAARLSIRDRGLLREGMHADIVIFDERVINDLSTFENPHQLSVGMMHVFVNGVGVIRNGRHTGAKPGRIVRGPGYKSRENRR